MRSLIRRRSRPGLAGLAGAALAGALGTTMILGAHTARLTIVNSERPAPPIAVAKVTGVPTTALRVVRTSKGAMVADSQGFLLYFYTRDHGFDRGFDHGRPSASACSSQCAVDWPPVLAGSVAPRLSGISPGQIGVLRRPDGLRQLTLDGLPLYAYRADTTPGVGTGNGINATWYLAGPAGRPAIPPARVVLPPNDPAMGDVEGDDGE